MVKYLGRFRSNDRGGPLRRVADLTNHERLECSESTEDPGEPLVSKIDDDEKPECKCGAEDEEYCSCKNDDEELTAAEKREKFMADYYLRNGIATSDAMARDLAKMSPTQRFIAASDRLRGRAHVARTADGLPVSDIGLSATEKFIAASKRLRAKR